MVWNLLNKLKWTNRLDDCEIIILERGSPENKKSIPGNKITEIKRHYFYYKNGEEIFIPMHRVLEIKEKGKVVWKRKLKQA